MHPWRGRLKIVGDAQSPGENLSKLQSEKPKTTESSLSKVTALTMLRQFHCSSARKINQKLPWFGTNKTFHALQPDECGLIVLCLLG